MLAYDAHMYPRRPANHHNFANRLSGRWFTTISGCVVVESVLQGKLSTGRVGVSPPGTLGRSGRNRQTPQIMWADLSWAKDASASRSEILQQPPSYGNLYKHIELVYLMWAQ